MGYISLIVLVGILLSSCRYSPEYWEFTRKKPRQEDVVGQYVPDQKARKFIFEKRNYPKEKISINLGPDGSFELKNIPDCWLSDFGKSSGKFNSGGGTWELAEHDSRWTLSLHFPSTEHFSAKRFKGGFFTFVMLIGEKPPYIIYLMVGDPDGGEGMRFEKIGPKTP
jgi:hypothetical protein